MQTFAKWTVICKLYLNQVKPLYTDVSVLTALTLILTVPLNVTELKDLLKKNGQIFG